jgi:hypothetical protein
LHHRKYITKVLDAAPDSAIPQAREWYRAKLRVQDKILLPSWTAPPRQIRSTEDFNSSTSQSLHDLFRSDILKTMARTKSTPHRSPSFPGDRDLAIPRTVTAPDFTRIDDGEPRLGVPYDHEVAVSTDWVSPQLAVREAQHQHDLVKAGRIITAFNSHHVRTEEGEPVTRASLDWAMAIGIKEDKLEKADEVEKKEKAKAAFEQGFAVEPPTTLAVVGHGVPTVDLAAESLDQAVLI